MNPVVGSIIGTVANNVGGVLSTRMANKANRELAEYSYAQERQMIAEQNAYNHPAAQMARYKEAGLNPNLIYGSGQASAGNQATIARYNAPRMEAPSISLGDALTMAQAAANIRKTKAETDNLNLQGDVIHQDKLSRLLNNMILSKLTGFNPGVLFDDKDEIAWKNSLRYKRENAEIGGLQSSINAKEAQVGLYRMQQELARLSGQEKDYIYKNILELQKVNWEKRNSRLNQIVEQSDKLFGYQHGSAIARIISLLAGAASAFL